MKPSHGLTPTAPQQRSPPSGAGLREASTLSQPHTASEGFNPLSLRRPCSSNAGGFSGPFPLSSRGDCISKAWILPVQRGDQAKSCHLCCVVSRQQTNVNKVGILQTDAHVPCRNRTTRVALPPSVLAIWSSTGSTVTPAHDGLPGRSATPSLHHLFTSMALQGQTLVSWLHGAQDM